ATPRRLVRTLSTVRHPLPLRAWILTFTPARLGFTWRRRTASARLARALPRPFWAIWGSTSRRTRRTAALRAEPTVLVEETSAETALLVAGVAFPAGTAAAR